MPEQSGELPNGGAGELESEIRMRCEKVAGPANGRALVSRWLLLTDQQKNPKGVLEADPLALKRREAH